jgi:hypothetical protein
VRFEASIVNCQLHPWVWVFIFLSHLSAAMSAGLCCPVGVQVLKNEGLSQQSVQNTVGASAAFCSLLFTRESLLQPHCTPGIPGVLLDQGFQCWHRMGWGLHKEGIAACTRLLLGSQVSSLFQEDHYALLVKAWETKVFPTIRRRFRNEAERKSGLDQIKGALQLGLGSLFSWGVKGQEGQGRCKSGEAPWMGHLAWWCLLSICQWAGVSCLQC